MSGSENKSASCSTDQLFDQPNEGQLPPKDRHNESLRDAEQLALTPDDTYYDLSSPNSPQPTGLSPRAFELDRSESAESSNNDDSDYAEPIIRNASRSQRKRWFAELVTSASPDEHEEQCATMQAEKRRRRHLSASDDNNDDDNSMTSSGAGSDANVASVDDNSSSGSSSSVAAPQLPEPRLTVEQLRDISLRQWIEHSGLRLNDEQTQLLKQNLLRRGNMKKMQQLLKHEAFKDVFRFTSDDESSLEIKTGFVYKFTALCCYFENDLKGKACTEGQWDKVWTRAKELWNKAWLGDDCEDGWSSKTENDRCTTAKKPKTTSARKQRCSARK